MRPSDADRNRAVDVLAAAFTEGRLDGAEHRRRLGAVLQATSFARLRELTDDLPVGALPLPPKYVQPSRQPSPDSRVHPSPRQPLPDPYGSGRGFFGKPRIAVLGVLFTSGFVILLVSGLVISLVILGILSI